MMRQNFENWYSDNGKFPRAIERNGHGYKLKQAHDAWTSWQIAAKVTAESCAKISDDAAQLFKPGSWDQQACITVRERIRSKFNLSD